MCVHLCPFCILQFVNHIIIPALGAHGVTSGEGSTQMRPNHSLCVHVVVVVCFFVFVDLTFVVDEVVVVGLGSLQPNHPGLVHVAEVMVDLVRDAVVEDSGIW